MSIKQGGNTIAGLQDISGKANTDLSNVLSNIDFVVESQLPTAANNYTWYRKYKSGWVEQAGYIGTVTRAGTSVSLPVTMADTNYNIIATTRNSSVINELGLTAMPSAMDSFTLFLGGYNGSALNLPCYWQVSGMAAS